MNDFLPYPHQKELPFILFILAFLSSTRWNLKVVLIYLPMMTKNVEHIFGCGSAICASSFQNSLFRSIFHFLHCSFFPCCLVGLFVCLFSYIYFGHQPFIRCVVVRHLFPLCSQPFCLNDCDICIPKCFSFMRSQLPIIVLSTCYIGVLFKKSFSVPISTGLFPTLSSSRFSVSELTLGSLIYFFFNAEW